MIEPQDEPPLTIDEAFRATFHFIEQYYRREPIEPFELLLSSMRPWATSDAFDRQTSDPATWDDWLKSAAAARQSELIPEEWRPRRS